jgi:membrane-associated protease RseP (regulator of RpoE activity)
VDRTPPDLPPSPPPDHVAWRSPDRTPGAVTVAPATKSRPWLHALLLAATFLTLLFAGTFWIQVPGVETAADLLDPVVAARILLRAASYAFWVTLILGAHEMGHYLACRHYGIPATLPFFIPGIPPLGSFGAVIRIRGVIPDRRALFDVAAAGPLAGFAIALPVLLTGYLIAEPVDLGAMEEIGGLYIGDPLALKLAAWFLDREATVQTNALIGAGWVGMLVTSLNLFPVGQLDGGHAAYAFSRRLHRVLAFSTIAGVAALVLYQGIVQGQTPAYLVWFVLLLWMRNRHPRLRDESRSLGNGRRLVALALLIVFLLSFIPVPFTFVEG